MRQRRDSQEDWLARRGRGGLSAQGMESRRSPDRESYGWVDSPRRLDQDLVERLRAYVQPAREAPRMEDTVTEVAKLILQAAGQGGRR